MSKYAPAYSSFILVRTLSVTNAATLLKLITPRIVLAFVIKSEGSYGVGEFRASNIVIKTQFLPISPAWLCVFMPFSG